MKKIATSGMLVSVCFASLAAARGVSPYLPLQMEPEIERQIEQVLILADRPVLTRPIAAAIVFDALPKACERDEALCQRVQRYLQRYMRSADITHASAAGAATSGVDRTVPNRHGLNSGSEWEVSAQAYWQPLDHALISVGGVAYDADAVATGSMLSLGWSWAQLDVGYRDHWLSPLTDSAMLSSTEAPTMLSATISNYAPITRLGIRYEIFAAEMSESDLIAFEDGLTSGNPRIAGLHLSIEPASGWSLGVNRLMQYGGGERDTGSFKDVVKAFFNPSTFDNADGEDLAFDDQFGNQVASITSRFIFPGSVPFSVYAEYAGEDTSRGRNYLLGNSSLSWGIDFPRLWNYFDLTYEASEWQNAWYVNGLYGDGLTNEGRVIGHWGGDQRRFGDAVGAQTHMVRLGWQVPFGGIVEAQARTIDNETYSGIDYERGYDVTLRYSRHAFGLLVGGEVYAGKDVFGEDFSRIGAFFRYSPEDGGIGTGSRAAAERSTIARADGAELFVDLGANWSEVKADLDDSIPETTVSGAGPHVAIGARRKVSEHQDLGVRLEIDEIDSNILIGLRALDYRYRFDGPLAVTAFLGAARYDLATPAYGVYVGAGVQWRDLLPGWDVGLDARFASKIARDDLLPEDPVGGRPDAFYDIIGATLYVTRKF